MKRVFILGAGASRFAGYPLSLELWQFIRDKSDSRSFNAKRRRDVLEEMDRILKVLPPDEWDRPNLEKLFTLLELADREVGPFGIMHAKWEQIRPKVIWMISEALQWHEYQFQGALRAGSSSRGYLQNLGASPDSESILSKWTMLLRKGDTLIEFNWDLLHEAALFRAEKWHYADGYGFVCADAPAGISSPIKILKLHGSVNWAQENEQDCNPAIEYKAVFFAGSRDDHDIPGKSYGKENEGRNLVIPTYLKDMALNKLLVQLWNQAFDALSNAGEIFVIGYSLYPADALTRQLLALALSRNFALKEIQVISPGTGLDHWDSFCGAIGKERKSIPTTFEDWVRAVR